MKISLENLTKIMEHCTKKEIDLIIYVGQFQDVNGVIKGISYTDVMDNVCISKSTFYKLLYSLEEKGIISICSLNEDHGYWSVKILNNVFACKKDCKKGYVKLNYKILHTDAFKFMTKGEKLIILNLLRLCDRKKNYIKVTYNKMMDWTGRSLRSVKKFVETITKVFQNIFKAIVIQENNVCSFSVHAFESRAKFEKDVLLNHLINHAEKVTKSEKANKTEIKDTITVLKQYKLCSADVILDVLKQSLKHIGRLAPANINTLSQLKKNVLGWD